MRDVEEVEYVGDAHSLEASLGLTAIKKISDQPRIRAPSGHVRRRHPGISIDGYLDVREIEQDFVDADEISLVYGVVLLGSGLCPARSG